MDLTWNMNEGWF